MSNSNIKKHLTDAISQLDESFTNETIEFLLNDKNEVKKKNQKKILALVVTMIAIKGYSKYKKNHNVNI